MKHIFIFNRQFCKRELLNKIYNACVLFGYDFLLVEAGTEEDVKEVARKYKMENAIIYAVGMDKAVHLILNEIIGGTAKIGVLPLLKNSFYTALDNFYDREILASVMKVNDSYGFGTFSLGIDAALHRSYNIKEFVMSFLGYKNQPMFINDYLGNVNFLTVKNEAFNNWDSNSPLRICLTENLNKLQSFRFLSDYMLGTHELNRQAQVFTSSDEVHIKGFKPLAGWFEGEEMMDSEYSIVPNAKHIIVVNNRPLIRELNLRGE